jgi:hypothetical protein
LVEALDWSFRIPRSQCQNTIAGLSQLPFNTIMSHNHI